LLSSNNHFLIIFYWFFIHFWVAFLIFEPNHIHVIYLLVPLLDVHTSRVSACLYDDFQPRLKSIFIDKIFCVCVCVCVLVYKLTHQQQTVSSVHPSGMLYCCCCCCCSSWGIPGQAQGMEKGWSTLW
jgi:hypothetical protein